MRATLLACIFGGLATCLAVSFSAEIDPPADLAPPETGTKAANLTFDHLREGIRKRYSEINAIEVEFLQTTPNAKDANVIPVMGYHFAFKGEKRFFSEASIVSGNESLVGAGTFVNDEKTQQDYVPGSKSGWLHPATDKQAICDKCAYIYALGIPLSDLERARAAEMTNFLPFALDAADNQWVVLPALAVVDGAECHVLESKDKQRFWIDPKLGFAVRFSEAHQSTGDKPKAKRPLDSRHSFRDFQRIDELLWLPRSIDFVSYMRAREPESRWNLPDHSSSLRVKRLAVNDHVPDSLFKITFPPGTNVRDDIQHRYYHIGDANEQLDITLRETRGTPLSSALKRWVWLLIANLAALAVLAAIIGYKVWKRR